MPSGMRQGRDLEFFFGETPKEQVCKALQSNESLTKLTKPKIIKN